MLFISFLDCKSMFIWFYWFVDDIENILFIVKLYKSEIK